MKATGKTCATCNRPHGIMRERGVLRVLVCEECYRDWFRRERAFIQASGGAWDAAEAGRPKS